MYRKSIVKIGAEIQGPGKCTRGLIFALWKYKKEKRKSVVWEKKFWRNNERILPNISEIHKPTDSRRWETPKNINSKKSAPDIS